jgi:hypothetical protein
MGSTTSKIAKSSNAKIAENISELIGNTPLVKLGLDPEGRYVKSAFHLKFPNPVNPPVRATHRTSL